MPFFDQVGKKISNLSQDAVKKTKELTEITKLNLQVSSEEETIKNLYTQIGKLYFDEFGTEPNEMFLQHCSSIAEASVRIQCCKLQIKKLKGLKTCSNCGAEMTDQSIFCGGCGFKNEDKDIPSDL